MELDNFFKSIIKYAYYGLFFFTPLLLTKVNYELFEFNKMIAVYTISIIVGTFWAFRMINQKKFLFKNTLLDIPIALFLFFHIISTLYSIDPYISIWGYYGRFNGGLVSLFSYIILYYGLISNINITSDQNELNNSHSKNSLFSSIHNMIYVSLASGLLVSLYGIAQHFGVDAHLWVQDVQNRVFSTLGQPNWLAAYVSILIPIAASIGLLWYLSIKNASKQIAFLSQSTFILFSITSSLLMLYLTLLYTKSRSGFPALWVSLIFFGAGTYLLIAKYKPYLVGSVNRKKNTLLFGTGIVFAFLIITIIVGSPFEKLNGIHDFFVNSSDQISIVNQKNTDHSADLNEQPSTTNITDSWDIRKLVWQGAIDATVARPWFGWGVETFAWVFYKYKPLEHNATSEWDFLYNKAHNEYLNYAATTGLFGLGSYLLIIGLFIWWAFFNLVHVKKQVINYQMSILCLGLFTGWFSLLITNFFGFSVFITSVYFWLIPAMIFVLHSPSIISPAAISSNKFSIQQWIGFVFALVTGVFLIISLVYYWVADYNYANAKSYIRSNEYSEAARSLYTALSLRPYEPTYHDYLANTLAPLAVVQYEAEINDPETIANHSASSSDIADRAILASETALSLSPGNVTFWKTYTRTYYTLSQIDEAYAAKALSSVLKTQQLAPNDPKITYNVGIIYETTNNTDEAINSFKHALELKPDYKDAAWALAIFYDQTENSEEKEKWLHYILEKIDPNDAEVKRKLGIE